MQSDTASLDLEILSQLVPAVLPENGRHKVLVPELNTFSGVIYVPQSYFYSKFY